MCEERCIALGGLNCHRGEERVGGQQVDLDEDEGVEGRMDGPGWWLRGQRVRGQGREDGDGKGGKGGKTGSGGWMG